MIVAARRRRRRAAARTSPTRPRRTTPSRPPGRCSTLAGEWTFDSFSEHLGDARHLPGLHARAGRSTAATGAGASSRRRSTSRCARRTRRCTSCSAATAEPVTFVVSSRMGEPPTIAPVTRRLAVYPALRFKLDATPDWTDELIAALQETGAVDSIDFKGAYKGTRRRRRRPTRRSTGRSPRRSRTPGSRIPTSRPTRRATRSRRTRTGSPGTRRSTPSQDILDRAGDAAHGQPQAVALRLA